MIEPDRIFKLAEDISFQSLGEGEGAVVLEVKSGQLHTCNDTTAEFLSAIDGSRSFRDVLELLESKFDVDHEVLKNDMINLANQLIAEKVIV